MTATDTDFIVELLRLAAKHDITNWLQWDEELVFGVKCDDVFLWGCDDEVLVTKENIHMLREALEVGEYHNGVYLFCARVCGMRPQGAMYQYLAKPLWPLFNACGPEREVGLGNPEPIPEVTDS